MKQQMSFESSKFAGFREFVPINHTDIVLQDVSFSYDGTTQNEVLHGISLNMPQGSFTALVGPSGEENQRWLA
ncbi:MAG: hypothetical protein ACLTC0_14880 [Eisenbergiella massiliensis]|uniref:hypothetical protein n=1 Tax=Eisenbergiella massiliensis TaxID=1720294 RepID=UPI00399376DA